MNNSNVFK
jgi:hypothetical protein